MGLIRLVLKRPVAAVMILFYLLVSGISPVFSATLEQMSDTDTLMLIVMGRYSGAGSEDINELVTEPIEDEAGTLEGVKSMPSPSSDGRSMAMLEYDYGTDMDEAYDDLKKKLDSLKRQLPDDVETSVMEMNNNVSSTMMLSIPHKTEKDLHDYVDQKVVPELEKITSVADVKAMGGFSEYIRTELQSKKMAQYKLTMSQIGTAMSAVNLSYPSGDVVAGNLELSVTASAENDTLDDSKRVPITTSSGQIVYLEDAANVYEAEEQRGGIPRYDGQETISLSISKQQSSTAMDVSSAVQKTITSLETADEDLHVIIARDIADSILNPLQDVTVTMVLVVVISTIIIFVFFGDYKASLIVGSSIPTSILLSLIFMTSFGFSLNIITMSALVPDVGMMVDSSIVMLENCFRATDEGEDKGLLGYAKLALGGIDIVLQPIIGFTITICMVFIPLVFLQGMMGQMFKPLGHTTVSCMSAFLFLAMTVVPLSYMMYKPKEMEKAPTSRPVVCMQNAYRRIMPGLLKHKALVMIASVAITIATLVLASGMEAELMTSDDTGTVNVSTETRPSLLIDQANDILSRVEDIVASNEDADSYTLRYNNSSGTITAYLKDGRTMDTEDVVMLWEKEMSDIDNCTITVEASTSTSFMGRGEGYETILHDTQRDELKEVSDKIVKEMTTREDVANAHSSVENTAPVATIEVDPIMAAAEELSPSEIGSMVSQMLDGVEVTILDIDGREVSVMAEYPEEEYRTVDQLQGIVLSKPSGGYVALVDIAGTCFKDNSVSVSKTDKPYEITIITDYTGGNVKPTIDSEVINPNLSGIITTGANSRDRMMQGEFSALYQAIAIAVSMVLTVMSAQFESPKFSFMIMTIIPFGLVGPFGLLKLTGVSISMISLLGSLILVGTMTNNGILYVDTVSQYRMTMDLKTALVRAGAIRLRPILMTSLTITLSMIPMALATGNSGSTIQGLAMVNIGGLTAGVLVALFILSIYYTTMNGNKKQVVLDIQWDLAQKRIRKGKVII